MTTKKNLAASVRQKLLNRARNDFRPFSELLQYYAMERFLYRLSQSKHADRFILKGALMLRVWQAPEIRPTMDIDMLGKTSNDEENLIAQIKDILSIEIEPDGLSFSLESLHAEQITEDADYPGIRIRFRGTLDSARINMQLDIGFGDIVYPAPVQADLPTLLDNTAPRLLCYSRESAIAEKFEAMIKLGILNSRMKDFYDIWLLSRQFNFEGPDLAEAVRLTCNQRSTPLTENIQFFQEEFITQKQVQWMAFRKRLKQEHLPSEFKDIISKLDTFLSPVVDALLTGEQFDKKWTAAKNWE